MTPKVPVPTAREAKSHYKQRCWQAQMAAQLALQGQPEAYRQFCTALKAQWTAFKARPTR